MDKEQPKQEAPQPVAPPQLIPPQQAPAPAPAPVAAAGVTPSQPASGMAIAAMILGIVSLLSGLVAFLGFALGLTALILGIVCLKKKAGGKGMAIAGIATGAVSIVWNTIVTIFFIMALILASAGAAVVKEAGDEVEKTVTTYSEEQQAKIDSKKVFAKGQTAVFDIYDVKVNLVTRNYVPEETYAQAGDGKELIVVNVTVTNNSDESQYLSSYAFKISENGIANSPEIFATVDPEFEGGTLAPDATTTGNIVFEVSKNATGLKLQYETYAYDSEAGESKTLVYTLAI